MKMNRVEEIIKDTLEIDQITSDQNLQDAGMDSISFVKIIVALEVEYNIEFADEDLLITRLSTMRAFETRVTELIGIREN